MQKPEQYVLLTGCDLGDRYANLDEAKTRLESAGFKAITVSDVYESEPWGFEADTRFLNQAILIETHLEPAEILSTIKSIESDMGRGPRTENYSSRIIDIDILCSENRIYHTESLTIPHKHLHERLFALIPLVQVASNWKHPLLKLSYKGLLEKLVLEEKASKTA